MIWQMVGAVEVADDNIFVAECRSGLRVQLLSRNQNESPCEAERKGRLRTAAHEVQ